MTTKELVQVAQWIDERVCEYKYPNTRGWRPYPDTDNGQSIALYISENFQDYRRKPTPTLRPWTPEEVPVGALIRTKQNQEYIIMGRNTHGHGIGFVEISAVNIVRGGWQIFDTKNREHSLDHGITWKPCGILCNE